MKSTQQVIEWIDRYMSYAVESPRLYARSATELEGVFFTLDNLREYALNDDEDLGGLNSRYSVFCSERDVGARGFIESRYIDNPQRVRDDAIDFLEFTEFWKSYLAWRDCK
jgi:hypothetical protein